MVSFYSAIFLNSLDCASAINMAVFLEYTTDFYPRAKFFSSVPPVTENIYLDTAPTSLLVSFRYGAKFHVLMYGAPHLVLCSLFVKKQE